MIIYFVSDINNFVYLDFHTFYRNYFNFQFWHILIMKKLHAIDKYSFFYGKMFDKISTEKSTKVSENKTTC